MSDRALTDPQAVDCGECGHSTSLDMAIRSYPRTVLLCRGCSAVVVNRPHIGTQRGPVSTAL